MNPSPADILRDLANIPTASFHEEQIAGYIRRFLSAHEVPFTIDAYGDILAHYSTGGAAPASGGLALVSHMDHPALEIVSGHGRQCQAHLLGGVLLDYFRRPVPVRIFTKQGSVTGHVLSAQGPQALRQVVLSVETEGDVAPGDWGVWDLTDFQPDGDYFRLRAADDLAGCAVGLSTLLALKDSGIVADVYCVFTRGEEVGLLGSVLVAQHRLLPLETMVVSVESSRTLPGAEMGKGPVIRVGDFRRTFHHEAEEYLLAAWEALRQEDAHVKVQRQLLSGGTCEATAFSLLGYRTTGVALPLGNYHNMGENDTIAPEFIHKDDLEGAVRLLTKAVGIAAAPLTDSLLQRYGQVSPEHEARLRESFKEWGQ